MSRPMRSRGISSAGTVCAWRSTGARARPRRPRGAGSRTPRSSALSHGRADLVEAFGLDERAADLAARGGEEREGHGAADQERVDPFDQRARSTPSLSETFAPPRIATNGSLAGPARRDRTSISCCMSRPAADGSRSRHADHRARARDEPRRTRRRRRRRRATPAALANQGRSPPRAGRTAGSPAARRRPARAGRGTAGPRARSLRRQVTTSVPSSSRSRRATGPNAEATGRAFPSGRPRCEQRTSDAPRLEQLLERRERRADAHVVGDPALLERHVEVARERGPAWPDRSPRSSSVRRRTRRSQASRRRGATRSTSRFEYPHSLSYQPMTFTRLPDRHRRERVERARGRRARRCPRRRWGPRE